MHTKNRYLAFIDILGFKAIFDKLGDPEMLGDQMSVMLQSSIRSALSRANVEVDDDSDLNVLSDIKVYQFSDSIVLYTEDDSHDSLMNIIITLNLLFAQSIIRGFPLRGALTQGKLYVKGSVVVGDALIRAYKLESRQEWAGLVIDCELQDTELQLLLEQKLVIECEVSMKDELDKTKILQEKQIVINWPQYCGTKISSEEEFIRSFSKYSGEPEKDIDKNKRKRTLDFFKDNLGGKELPSFIFGTGRVVLMKDGMLGILKE